MDKDNIHEDYFLCPNNDYIDNYTNLINKTIYYPKMISKNKINYLKSEIKSINQYEFIFSSEEILSCEGYPIFLEETTSVLGIIHNHEKYDNFGYLLFPIINSLKKNNIIKGKKDYDIAIYEGEFKDGKREGYGDLKIKMGVIIMKVNGLMIK